MATYLCRTVAFNKSRAFLRCLHLYRCREGGTGSSIPLGPDTSEVDRIALGVGGVALYSKDISDHLYFHSETQPTRPACLVLPREQLVKCVSVGRTHLTILAHDHTVFTAGGNAFGQCGYYGNSDEKLTLKEILALSPIKQVVCGLDHTLLLTASGRVVTCGWSADGQTGVGHYDNVYEPTPLDIENVTSVHTCGDSCFAVTGGDVYGWGNNEYGQLGVKTRDQQAGGDVYGWGNNEYGQLGVKTRDQQVCSPVQLDLSGLDSEVVSIASGGAFTGMLTAAGSVYVAGYPIEDSSLCAEGGRTMIDPHHLSVFRKLTTRSDVASLCAGLNYLVACLGCDSAMSRDLLVWGRYPCDVINKSNRRKMVRVASDAMELSFGATETAALFRDAPARDSPVFTIS